MSLKAKGRFSLIVKTRRQCVRKGSLGSNKALDWMSKATFLITSSVIPWKTLKDYIHLKWMLKTTVTANHTIFIRGQFHACTGFDFIPNSVPKKKREFIFYKDNKILCKLYQIADKNGHSTKVRITESVYRQVSNMSRTLVGNKLSITQM